MKLKSYPFMVSIQRKLEQVVLVELILLLDSIRFLYQTVSFTVLNHFLGEQNIDEITPFQV